MHTFTFARRSFAAAALSVVVAVSPAEAQRVIASNVVRAAVQPVEEPSVLRTIAIYQFEASRSLGMPNQVTLSDSLGKLFATFTVPGNSTEQSMMVDVTENDIVLQARTMSGILTLVLFERNPGTLSPLRGHWYLGEREGELLGRGAR